MRSDVCKIEKGTGDLAAILKESEKVAVYNELDRKQTMQLRLLCEELDGMLPEIIGDFEGKLWIEFEKGLCRINVSITMTELSAERREELIKISKNGKNAAAVGLVGKIRSSMEKLMLDTDFADAFSASMVTIDVNTGYYMGMDYTSCWSMGQFKHGEADAPEQPAQWDELERSVIESVADDVVVGVKGKRADIVIIKKFY